MLTLLPIFGIAFCAFAGTAIVLPWLRKKRDLLTSWNIFLLGSINFVGIACLSNAPMIRQANLEDLSILEFMFGTVVFYTLASWIYYRRNRSSSAGTKILTGWPSASSTMVGSLAVLFALLGFGLNFVHQVPVLGEVANIVVAPLSVAAVGLSLVVLARQPWSPASWILFAGTSLPMLMNSLGRGIGRRDLVSVLLIVIGVLYWQVYRYKPVTKSAVRVVLLSLTALVMITAFTSIRHAHRHDDRQYSPIELAIKRLTEMPEALANAVTNSKTLIYNDQSGDTVIGGQNAVFCAVLTIDTLRNRPSKLDVHWFMTLHYIAIHPVPRAFWPDKPVGLGVLLPRSRGIPITNWGPGIIGHCYFDGGLIAIVVYALLLGWIFRTIDNILMRDAHNPYPWIIVGSVSGQLVGFARGDCGVLSVICIGGVFAAIGLFQLARFFSPYRAPTLPTIRYQQSPQYPAQE